VWLTAVGLKLPAHRNDSPIHAIHKVAPQLNDVCVPHVYVCVLHIVVVAKQKCLDEIACEAKFVPGLNAKTLQC
jgi:hypothetical protein